MKYHDCRKTQEQITDWLFDENSPTIPPELTDCRACLDQYLSMKDALGLFDQAAPALQPAEEYWPGYEAKLRVKLAQESIPSRWQQWFHRPLWLIPVAAVLLVLFFSLAWSRGRSTDIPSQSRPEIADLVKPEPKQESEVPRQQPRGKRKLDNKPKLERKEPARQPNKKPHLLFDPNPMMALASLTAENPATLQHVERAQRLLRSLRNASPAGDSTFDLAYEQKQARQLVYQNILLRREAETRGDWLTEEMLSGLEPLLLDIGNLPARPTTDDVSPIKERMQKNEIVARLQLYATPVTVARAD